MAVLKCLCASCSKEFHSTEAYQQHAAAKQHTFFLARCEDCKIVFGSQVLLKQHFRESNVHPSCLRCTEAFRDHALLSAHMAEAHLVRCKPCHRAYLREEIQQHYRESLDHPKCPICGDGFETETLFTEHTVSVHSNTRCVLCSRLFRTVEELHQHYKDSDAHPQCNLCEMGFKDEVAYDQHMDMLHLPLTANPSPALSARSINETDFSQIQSLPVSPLPRPIPTSQPQTVHSSPETPASDVLVHFASNGIPPTNHVPRAVSEPSLRSISSLGKPSPVQTAQQFQPSPAVSQRTLREPNGDSAQIIVSGRSSSITSMSLFSVPSAPASADGSYRQSPSAISTSVMTPRASVFPASSDQVEVGSSVGKASEYFGVETRNSPSTVASRSPAISPRSILGMSLGPTTFRRPAVRQSITGDSSSYSSSGMSSASSRPPPDRSASVSSVSPAGNTTDTDLTVHDMPKPSVPIPIVSSTPPKSLSWHCRLCMKDPCVQPTATLCGHIFCQSCILKELASNMQCPVCKKVMLLRLHAETD